MKIPNNLRLILLLLIFTNVSLAEVALKEQGSNTIIQNEFVSIRFDSNTGQATKVIYNGISLLAPEENTNFTLMGANDDPSGTVYTTKKEKSSGSKFLRQRNCVFKIHSQSKEMIDISFTPEPTVGFPFTMELHYVLRQGESGFYFYIVASKPESVGKAWLKQVRFGMRLNDSMTNIRLTDTLYGRLPDSKAMKNAKGSVMDATYWLQSGEWITKYDWACENEDVPVYGLHNDRQGAWIISGSHEYLNGGPTKQHNTGHATDRGPILLKLLRSSHFGSDGDWVEGDWEKIYGPVFVYLNSGRNGDDLWADAKEQASLAKQSWPYKWLKHPLYPIQRARVTGRFESLASASPLNAWAVLADPKEQRGLDWQQQGTEAYSYRAPIRDDGSFSIPAVRAGTYTLYAFADGVIGEFRKDAVEVGASGVVRLGALDWESRSEGELLWRIGIPNRSAREFRHGDNYRHWGLWYTHPEDFRRGVDFKIGRSQAHKDWNYAQTVYWDSPTGWQPQLQPIKQTGTGRWLAPEWKVRFDCTEPMSGTATLTLGIAGSTQCALEVQLNGKPLNKPIKLDNDSSLPRSGIRGRYQEATLRFDAARLLSGENVLSLQLQNSALKKGRHTNYPIHGVLYDFIQLEVK